MAESLTQALLTQTPDTNYVSDAVSSIGKGAASAASLEQLKLHNQQLRDQIDEKKEQFNNGVFDRTLSLLGQAARAPNPAGRNFMLEQSKKVADQYGIKVGPYIDYISKSGLMPERMAELEALAASAKQDATKWPELRAKITSILESTDPAAAESIIKDVKEAYKQEAVVDVAKSKMNSQQARAQEKSDDVNHRSVRTKMISDKVFNDYAQRLNSMEDAAKGIFGADKINSKSLNEFQQNLRRNFVGSQQSGVVERESTYISNLDTAIAQLKEKYGNDLDTIDKNDPIITHLLNLKDQFVNEVRDHLHNRLGATSSGMNHVYSRRKDMAADIGNVSDQLTNTFASSSYKKALRNPKLMEAIVKAHKEGFTKKEINKRMKGDLSDVEFDKIISGKTSNIPGAYTGPASAQEPVLYSPSDFNGLDVNGIDVNTMGGEDQ